MARKRSLTRIRNHGRRQIKPWCNGSWPDLNHDVLFLVMMKLGVFDFVSFSGVCKSWRSFALSYRDKFIASRPPIETYFATYDNRVVCNLEDGEGRRFKTTIPHSVGRKCVGVTCGYLILFGKETRDFWLVNPITRHQLHFPNVPFSSYSRAEDIRGILVFSPSVSGWVFVAFKKLRFEIWSSVEGKGTWDFVFSTMYMLDLHAFEGKIYTLSGSYTGLGHICEFALDPKPKLMLVETKNFPKPSINSWQFVSCGENLYVKDMISKHESKILKLDNVGEMKWVPLEKTTIECALLRSYLKSSAAVVKPLSWPDYYWSTRFAKSLPSGKFRLYMIDSWYFSHDCFNVNRLEV